MAGNCGNEVELGGWQGTKGPVEGAEVKIEAGDKEIRWVSKRTTNAVYQSLQRRDVGTPDILLQGQCV